MRECKKCTFNNLVRPRLGALTWECENCGGDLFKQHDKKDKEIRGRTHPCVSGIGCGVTRTYVPYFGDERDWT